ncbi:MAG TPA: MlaD family protein [Candidatus Baltobacteraceae bacterium]|jgi:ABC-type transporter Mla subunit MlaD
MSRQAIVGAFTLLGLVAIFAVYFVLANFSARVNGYQTGIHFASAAGLTKGAIVYESGVQVGTVSEIQMLDDFTVDVVLQVASWVDIPRDSDFIISAPLTGSSTLTIVPPRKKKEQLALLPRYVLPIDQQPRGKEPVSIQELLESGRGELNKFDALLTDLTRREPHLMDQLQSAIANANALAETANGAMQQLSHKGLALTDTLQRSLDTASASIVDLTGQLDSTVRRNGGRIDTLLTSLNRTADSLAVATDSLKSMATNPQLRAQLTDTVSHIQMATANIATLTSDLRNATENPQTQGQLRDTLAHIDAATQRATSLLGALGGTSSVYGVDAGATSPPASAPIMPPSPSPYVPSPTPSGVKQQSGEFHMTTALRNRIGDLAKNLIEVQIRLDELTPKAADVPNNALLSNDKGPQSDFNVVVLPHSESQVYAGVNDLSGSQTWNLALRQQVAPGVLLGGGILYSRLGVMGLISNKVFGFEGLAYDPRYGFVDAYLRLHATGNIDLFAGERDLLHSERRTVYGLQYRLLGGSSARP